MTNTKPNYKADMCEHCKQSKTYLLGVDKGTVEIVSAIARFIGIKGINSVHPRKEMEGTYLTSNQVGNLSRARFHGLIARVKGNPGNYLLTRKGAQFLRGISIPRFAIISKAEKHQIGYFEPEIFTIKASDHLGTYWEGINYEISEGDVITRPFRTTFMGSRDTMSLGFKDN